MYGNTINEGSLLEKARIAAQEIMDWQPDVTDIIDFDDAIHEWADSLVNVYTYPCVQEWLAAGMPEANDYGAEAGGTTIIEQVMAGMYYWYDEQIRETLNDLLDERNEKEKG